MNTPVIQSRNGPWRVAVLVRTRSPIWAIDRIAQAAVEALGQAGCLVRVVTTGKAVEHPQRFLCGLRRMGIDGAIDLELVWCLRPGQRLPLSKFPIVSAIGMPSFVKVDGVGVDEDAVARQALDHLLALGHRRIGYVIVLDWEHARARLAAFEKEARRRRVWNPSLILDLRARTTRQPYQSLELGSLADVQGFFDRHPKPVAMFSHNDYVSSALIEWLLERGYGVPRDVAVVGVDNHPLYALANVPLTTVGLPFAQIGRESVRLLLERLRGSPMPRCRRVRLRPTLFIRESTIGRPEENEWLNQVIGIMQTDFARPNLIRAIIERLGWRQDVLAQRFSRVMGCTLLEYRDRLRMEAASRILFQNSSSKVEFVARQVGFSSASRFAAAFRERFGAYPGEYRNSAQWRAPRHAAANA